MRKKKKKKCYSVAPVTHLGSPPAKLQAIDSHRTTEYCTVIFVLFLRSTILLPTLEWSPPMKNRSSQRTMLPLCLVLPFPLLLARYWPAIGSQAKVDDEGLCRFGWATQDANLNLGTDVHGYGFGGTGMKSYSGKFEEYGEAFCRGDTVGCRLDLVKV